MRLIDAGYLSWVYGTRPNFGGWDQVRIGFKGDIMCMDSPKSWRQELVQGYKGRRAEKRAENPVVQERKDQVEIFRSLLREDGTIQVCEHEGYEADDLVAIHFLLESYKGNEVESIIAMDKDLIQVPGMWPKMIRTDGEFVYSSISQIPRNLPGYWPRTKTIRDVLLGQLLFGDKSDSIPRIVYKKDASLVAALRRSDYPFQHALKYWPDQVRESLLQLVIPAVPLHDQGEIYLNDISKLCRDLDNGSYYMGGWKLPPCLGSNTSCYIH